MLNPSLIVALFVECDSVILCFAQAVESKRCRQRTGPSDISRNKKAVSTAWVQRGAWFAEVLQAFEPRFTCLIHKGGRRGGRWWIPCSAQMWRLLMVAVVTSLWQQTIQEMLAVQRRIMFAHSWLYDHNHGFDLAGGMLVLYSPLVALCLAMLIQSGRLQIWMMVLAGRAWCERFLLSISSP